MVLALLVICHVSARGSETSEQNIRKPFLMSVHTNMLYDALTVPNIGAEFYIGDNLSVNSQWMYAWWSQKKRNRFFRIYGGDLSLNYWFGNEARKKPLGGHHAGIYIGMFTFCFENGHTGYLGGMSGGNIWNRCMLNVGVQYGYSLPISRRLNLDFTIGVGYIGGKVVKYLPENGHYYWEATTRRRWFGPTKAEISLVWLIGKENVNVRKGGNDEEK